MVSTYSGVATIFHLVGGYAGDRMPKRIVLASFVVLQALGIVVLFFAGSLTIYFLAAVLMGMGGGRTHSAGLGHTTRLFRNAVPWQDSGYLRSTDESRFNIHLPLGHCNRPAARHHRKLRPGPFGDAGRGPAGGLLLPESSGAGIAVWSGYFGAIRILLGT